MTEQEYEKKLDELDDKVHEIWEQSFEKPYPESYEWYKNHPILKEYNKIYREYKLIKTPILSDMSDLDKKCHMKFKEFEKYCKIGPMFSDYDGSGVYATKDKVSDIGIRPSDIVSGVYRKDFDYVCWYNK